MASSANEKYFTEYNNLQRVKHALIRDYLKGWFPKLGMWSGRVLYLDTHAGQGQHVSGEDGSPVVALQTLLEHASRDKILRNSESNFFFIEHDEGNAEILRNSILELGELPGKVSVNVTQGDCFSVLTTLLSQLNGNANNLAPAFIFVDPYGFKIPCKILRDLLAAGRVELFVNIIWRELDMGIGHAQNNPEGGMANTITEVFGSDRWMDIDLAADVKDREYQTLDLLCDEYGAKWVTSMRMLGDNGATRYILAHFTNHSSGRDLMKDSMWKACPDGGFYARRSDNPDQISLISSEPDLAQLALEVTESLRIRPMRYSELIEKNLSTLWRETHLNNVIRNMRRERILEATDYTGRFSKNANPLLSILE